MKLSLIAPTTLIKRYGNQGDFHLTLGHLLLDGDTAYEKAIVDSGKDIYLDNGLFENGESMPLDELMDHAARLEAKYVFAPDVLFDREATEANVEDAYIEMFKANAKYGSEVKLAAVTQADNRVDFLESYEWMAENDQISLIGLSILAIPMSYKATLGTLSIKRLSLTGSRKFLH